MNKISWYPNQLRKSAGIPTERKGQSKSACEEYITWKIQMTAEMHFAMSVHHAHFEKKNGHWPWYITPIAKWKMARNLSSPKRSKNFCWLECWRFMSTELSLRLSDRGCLELNFLVESTCQPSKRNDQLICSDRMRNEKTQHINTVFWLSAAQSVSKFGNVLGTRSL